MGKILHHQIKYVISVARTYQSPSYRRGPTEAPRLTSIVVLLGLLGGVLDELGVVEGHLAYAGHQMELAS